MPRYDVLVVLGGLVGYLVSIISSTALVLLFYRTNLRLLPGVKVTDLFAGGRALGRTDGDSDEERRKALRSLAPAVALGAATLCEAYLLQHAVSAVMVLAQDFLITYGNHLLTGEFPLVPFFKMLGLSISLLACLSALAVLSIWIAGHLFDWMTPGIDELKEIAQGNLAFAILFAFVLFAITLILSEGIESVARVLIPYNRPGVLRLP